MAQQLKASIIGASGYTGLEVLRLLLAHPHVQVTHLSSRQHENTPIGDVFPHLAHSDLRLEKISHMDAAKNSDVVFLALPHKTAQDVVADLHGKVKVIDLSADYRLDDAATYERYYEAHKHPHLLKEVVYGAPEIVGRQAVAKASSVANPGCFALLAQLMLFPLKGHIAQADIVAVTGSSGAGKSPTGGTHHPIRSHEMKSYNINKHRHIPEIIRAAGIDESQLNFVPTSGPFVRGIFAQGFVTLKKPQEAAILAQETYKNAPFVRLQNTVALSNIVGSNFCDLSYQTGNDGCILVQGALDNLVKGAAGAAIQNMNLMFGFEETTGLNAGAIYP